MKNINIIFGCLFLGLLTIVMSSSSLKEDSQTVRVQVANVIRMDLSNVIYDRDSLSDFPKPLVNYDFFETLVKEVKSHREKRLISWDSFLLKSLNDNTVILDTRSKEMFDLKHVKGAVHLNFSDFTQQALDNLFSSFEGRSTQILIYCNNNFYDAFELMFQDQAFVSKSTQPVFESSLEDGLKENETKQTLALNIPTYINLYGYGYRNVFELHEFIEVHDPRIQFEGTFDDAK